MDSLARRFINAYNQIDYSLRTIYSQKRSLSFSDAVRRSVSLNSVVRKYEEKLIDYGRLRNAIVHSNNPNVVMAEPHEEVVVEIEKIAHLISIPPLVLSIAKKEVVGVESSTKIKQVLMLASDMGYSNIAIFENEAIIGVANLNLIMRSAGLILNQGRSLDEFITKTAIKDVINNQKIENYYSIQPSDCTVEKALDLFYNNRKLTCIIITKTGNFLEKPLGIITTADIMDLNRILEDY